MKNINKITLLGNITRNPELKDTNNGQNLVSFGLATNRVWNSDGQKHQDAEFHQIIAWGRLAEICNTILKKGSLTYIEGYIKTRTWDNDDGTKSYRTEIIAEEVILLNHNHYENTNNEHKLPTKLPEQAVKIDNTDDFLDDF